MLRQIFAHSNSSNNSVSKVKKMSNEKMKMFCFLQVVQYCFGVCLWQRSSWSHHIADILSNFGLFVHNSGLVQFTYMDLFQAQRTIHQSKFDLFAIYIGKGRKEE